MAALSEKEGYGNLGAVDLKLTGWAWKEHGKKYFDFFEIKTWDNSYF